MRGEFKSFLIINLFGIGDVLFTLPLARNLRENFPSAEIFYLCNRRAYPLLENDPAISKVFVYERDEFEAVKKISWVSWIKKICNFVSGIKRENIEVAFDLSLNSQFGFLSWAAGIKERIGYNYKNRGRFLTKKIKLEGYGNKHVIEYYLRLLNLIGIKPEYRKLKLHLSKEQENNAAFFLKQQGVGDGDLLITIAPCGGDSWGKDSFYKHWPKEKFAELADRLSDEYGVKIILAGSAGEKAVIDDIERLMKNKPVKAIDLPLMVFFALLKMSAMLIANDGGPLHMGVFSGIRIVSIFGPVSEVVYGPYPGNCKEHTVIKKDLPCRPCYKNFRLPECPFQLKCLTAITVDEVFKAAEAFL